MTDSTRGSHGPPWSVDLLADLHAGVLDDEESARLWPLVNADPDARGVLDALDSVKIDLGQFGNAPVEPMPAAFVTRLDAALATEARSRGPVAVAPPGQPAQPVLTTPRPAPVPQPAPSPPPAVPAPVVDLAAARKRRNRMAAWGAGVLTAAAAAAAIAFVALPDTTTGGSPNAAAGDDRQTEQPAGSDAGAAPEPPLALSRDDLSSAIGKLPGETDYGALEDEAGLQTCLDSHGIEHADTVGVSPVTFDGDEGVAALLGAGAGAEAGRFRLVIVTPTCDDVLANTELP